MKNELGSRSLPQEVVDAILSWERSKHDRASISGSVLSHEKAVSCIAKLFWSGCDPLTVLQLLSNFVGKGMHVRRIRKRMKSILKRVARLSSRLDEDAKEVRAVDDEFLKLDFDFPNEMELCADYLKGLYTDEVQQTIFARGSGLQAELVDAVQLVRISTGRPHYAEIAELVAILGGKPVGEDNLRKTVENFKETLFRGPRSVKQIKVLNARANAKWTKLRKLLKE